MRDFTSGTGARASWPIRRLRFLARLNPPRSEVRGLPPTTEVSFVPMDAVGEYGGIRLEETRLIESVYGGYTYFRDGDVLVAKITPCFENGKGAICAEFEHGIGFGTTELHVLRPVDGVDKRFLFYLTISQPFRDAGTAAMIGAAGQKRVPEDFIRDYRVAVPSLDEQRAIADFLDEKTAAIDALIAKKERLIGLLEERSITLICEIIRQGLDSRGTFKPTAIGWLGNVPEHWEVAPLYAKCEVQLGKMLNPDAATGEHRAPYLRNANVQWDRVVLTDLAEMSFSPSERSKFRLLPGDLLVCEGGDVGRTAIWRGELEECYYQKAIHRVRVRSEGVNPRYIYYVLRAASHRGAFLADGNKSTIVHLTAEKLRRHRFPFPPANEQNAIVDFLDKKLERHARIQQREAELVDKLREYRQTLISAAVTGQIDIRKEIEVPA